MKKTITIREGGICDRDTLVLMPGIRVETNEEELISVIKDWMKQKVIDHADKDMNETIRYATAVNEAIDALDDFRREMLEENEQ